MALDKAKLAAEKKKREDEARAALKARQGQAKNAPAKPPAKSAPAAKATMALVKPEKTSTAVGAASNLEDLFLADAGSGTEGMGAADLAIPRLAILQVLSPQCTPTNDLYIDGAEAGMIYDNVSGQLYDGQEGITLVLVSYRRAHLEWYPRNSTKGKGFVADHGADPAILNSTTKGDKGANLTSKGTEIVPTAEYFALLVEPDGFTKVLISMAKTQLIKARRLNTLVEGFKINAKINGVDQLVRPALFYRSYTFQTIPESNDQGHWFGWKITPGENTVALPDGEAIYLEARSFKSDIGANKVKVQNPTVGEEHAVGGSGGRGGGGDDSPM